MVPSMQTQAMIIFHSLPQQELFLMFVRCTNESALEVSDLGQLKNLQGFYVRINGIVERHVMYTHVFMLEAYAFSK